MGRRGFYHHRRFRYYYLTPEQKLIEFVIFGVAFLVMLLVLLIIEYGRILLILVIALAIALIIYMISDLLIKKLRYQRLKNEYLATPYYKETERPYTKDILERELNFEISVFNAIRDTISKRYYLLHQYKIPNKEKVNSIKTVDLLLFHTTGIYVIECMNLSLDVIVRANPKQLEELKLEKTIDYNLFNMHKLERVRRYEKWIRQNIANSPIAQNQKKINLLNEVFDVEFENALIFSPEMLMGEENIPRTISSIYAKDEFMENLKTKKTAYNDFQLYKIYQFFRDNKNV
jgi:hypothetical protein